MGEPDRLRLKVYGGGHMLYLDAKSRVGLGRRGVIVGD
jgi:hypothetical protein